MLEQQNGTGGCSPAAGTAGAPGRNHVVLDLFCGAGGLSLGFTTAGYNLAYAVDSSAAAVETYRSNVGNHAQLLDLSDVDELSLRPTIVVGGPPCQGFSSAGLRRAGDDRNSLVSRFAHLVVRLRPLAFIFENVEGFLTTDDGRHVFDLLRPLLRAGYRIHLRKVNAANYGVPQHRKRVLAIGGLAWDPSFPEPTHSAYGAPGAHLAAQHLPQTPSLLDALLGLPAASVGPPGRPDDHYYRPLAGIDLERALALEPGQTMRDLPATLWHESYRKRAFRRVMDGTPTDHRGGAPFGVRRLRGDQPAKAITSGARSEFLHPLEDRLLTLRECARLQTFPDAFIFSGTASERAQLIGNAVPPRFASVIAENLASDLARDHEYQHGGALLSFVPTLSDGMSPALLRVARAVASEFTLQRASGEQLSLWP